MSLTTSCALPGIDINLKGGADESYNAVACAAFDIIPYNDNDIIVASRELKQAILAHNTKWEKLCGKD